jgi:hypothetical protein
VWCTQLFSFLKLGIRRVSDVKSLKPSCRRRFLGHWLGQQAQRDKDANHSALDLRLFRVVRGNVVVPHLSLRISSSESERFQIGS